MLSQGIPVRLKFGPTGKSFINGAGYKVGISHVIPEAYMDGEWIPVVSKTGSNGIPYVTTDRNGDGITIHDPQYISLQEGMKRWLVHRDLSSEEMQL
jgi:hypothetical protein